MTSIIVPSKYPEIFWPCAQSLELHAPNTSKILIRDGKTPYASSKAWDIATRGANNQGWHVGFGPDAPFNYARNVNIGIRRALTVPGHNILLCNDDVRFLMPDTIYALERVLEVRPDIGILSPRIHGFVGNKAQQDAPYGQVQYSDERLAFVCVMIRREVLEEIGLLDEQFGDGDYGWEDVDYCLRAREGGWKLGVTGQVIVFHGDAFHNSHGSTSFDKIGHQDFQSRRRFFEKWGHNRFN